MSATSRSSNILDEEEKISSASSTSNSTPQSASPSPSRTLALTYASAGLGNAISAICSNPQDAIKVRQQLLLDKERANFLTIGKDMIQKEGLKSLWNGVGASCLRELTYSTIRIGSYESFKDFYSTTLSVPETSFALKVLSGLTSGAIGSALTSPVDLVKVRFQAVRPNGVKPYKNTLVAFSHVYKEGSLPLNPLTGKSAGIVGGFKSLYRGVGPTIVRAAILTSSQIATYDYAKNYIKDNGIGIGSNQEGLGLHFQASMIAGFSASVCSAPFDTVKIRMMQDKKREFKSALDCAGKLVRNEGPLALYKGFAMCWARLGSHTVISLILFEQLRALFGIKPL